MNLNDFHYLLGQTIMFCQIIENDIKLIYSAMEKGKVENTLKRIDKWSLGVTVRNLKRLDYSDGDPYLSEDEYDYLILVSEKRNYWCHEPYVKFIYDEDFLNGKAFKTECNKLNEDNLKLSKVCDTLEKIRIKAMKDFEKDYKL